MITTVRTRYAPSPTGFMHVGNLRTAIYEYLIAKSNGGSFILRIEDTDQTRQVEGAVEVIYDTLKIAGLNHDEGPDIGGAYGPYIQSHRKTGYLEYAKQLVDKGAAYYCFCDKERLEELHRDGKEGISKYDRHCLRLSKEEIKAKLESGAPFVIRQLIPEGKTTFKDEVFGEITVDNKELEDQVLIKSDGLPTYNFANVVDDHLMEITHVVRGTEYLSSTPKYNLLYEAFGWEIPVYIHVTAVTNESGEKISKRKGAESIQQLVEKGYIPEAIVNYTTLLGWAPPDNREIFSLSELCDIFTLKGLSKSPSVFDYQKLKWMNGEYLKKMDFDEYYKLAEPVLKQSIKTAGIDLRHIGELCKTRIEFIRQIPSIIDFIDELPDYDIEMYTNKKMKTTSENSLDALKLLTDFLSAQEDFTNDAIYADTVKLAEEKGLKSSQLLWPLRTALSGKQATPCGASELCALLGKTESLRRLEIGIAKLESAQVEK